VIEMKDEELRQAMAVLESYNAQLESITRQVKLLQISLEETNRARESLLALKEAKEGDEILLPVGASSFVTVKVAAEKKVIVGVGSRVSVEKSLDDAVTFMAKNGDDIAGALNKAVNALNEVEGMTSQLTEAIQNEYRNRQAADQQ